MVTAWREFDLDADGVSIHLVRAGDPANPSVVLAHGFTDSGACWRHTIDALADRFDVVAPDARHHGRSASPVGGDTDEVDDLAAVIVDLGLGPVRLVGHSMGARTAAELVGRRPDLVERLVLEDPPWRPDNEHASGDHLDELDVRRYLRSLRVRTPDELERLAIDQHGDWPADEHPDWIAAKPLVREDAALLLGSRPWAPVAAAIARPTLLIHGDPELGGLTTPEVAARIADGNPHVSTAFVAGAGHNIRRERRDVFLTTVLGFLDA